MSTTVREVYNQVCYVCLEDFGFVLGVYSEAAFLDALAVVLLDFSQRAPLDKTIFTEMVNAGVSVYVVPEDLMKPEMCFIGGRLIEKVTEADLTQGHFEWKRQWGPPRQWHEDNLDTKRVQLFPIPDSNGAEIDGDAPPIGKYGDFYPSERNLTMVGPAAPSKTAWAIGNTLDGIPDSFTYYLVYGVLEQIFTQDGETRDAQRALYCHTRLQEAIYLSDSIAQEELLEEDD